MGEFMPLVPRCVPSFGRHLTRIKLRASLSSDVKGHELSDRAVERTEVLAVAHCYIVKYDAISTAIFRELLLGLCIWTC